MIATNFTNKLISWYCENKRDFPWRNSTNAYQIWLSEIILQQTKTAQGLPYYMKFTEHFKTINDLAIAEEQEVLKLWQGLGYYSRAKNLHFSAKYIVNELKGVFPSTYKDLLKLKGVGDYTASAIASICFDENCAVVDGNVYRVLSRYFGIELPINSSQGIKEFKKLAQSLLPKKEFGLYNQAIMDFGATICTPKKTMCTDCFLNDSCFALQQNKVALLPIKTTKTKIKKRFFNYLVILSPPQKISIIQRTRKDIWQHLYEFPLIESDHALTKSELIETTFFKKWSKKYSSVTLFNEKPIIHKLSHQHISTNFWVVNHLEEITNSIDLSKLKDYPVPVLIANFINEKFVY